MIGTRPRSLRAASPEVEKTVSATPNAPPPRLRQRALGFGLTGLWEHLPVLTSACPPFGPGAMGLRKAGWGGPLRASALLRERLDPPLAWAVVARAGSARLYARSMPLMWAGVWKVALWATAHHGLRVDDAAVVLRTVIHRPRHRRACPDDTLSARGTWCVARSGRTRSSIRRCA